MEEERSEVAKALEERSWQEIARYYCAVLSCCHLMVVSFLLPCHSVTMSAFFNMPSSFPGVARILVSHFLCCIVRSVSPCSHVVDNFPWCRHFFAEVPLSQQRSSFYQMSDVFSKDRARCLALVRHIVNECCHCHCHCTTRCHMKSRT